jgi:hypothetical protein
MATAKKSKRLDLSEYEEQAVPFEQVIRTLGKTQTAAAKLKNDKTASGFSDVTWTHDPKTEQVTLILEYDDGKRARVQFEVEVPRLDPPYRKQASAQEVRRVLQLLQNLEL